MTYSPVRPVGRPRQERCKHGHKIALWAYCRPDGGRECGACRAWRNAGRPAQPGIYGAAEVEAALAACLAVAA